jgi:hypothetical protein
MFRRLSFRLLLLIAFEVQTASSQDSKPQTRGKPARSIARGEWQLVRTIGLDSDLFEQPRSIVAVGDRILVTDIGDRRIKSLRTDGRVEWKAGARGRGPGEFLSFLGLAVDSAGNVIVYDPDNSRVTSLDARGRLRFVTPLARRADRVVAGERADRVLLLNTASDTFSLVADTAGTLRVSGLMPAAMRGDDGIAREMAGVMPTARGHLVAFRWSSTMWLIDRTGIVIKSCVGVDSLSFPAVREKPVTLGDMRVRTVRVDPMAAEAALDVTSFGRTTAVLRPGARSREHMLDMYEPECGRYLESRAFPYATDRIAGIPGGIAAIILDPVPHIAILRWIAR